MLLKWTSRRTKLILYILLLHRDGVVIGDVHERDYE